MCDYNITKSYQLMKGRASFGKSSERNTFYLPCFSTEALEHAKVYLLGLKERLEENFKDFKLSITWSIALDSAVADRIVCTAERGERIERTEGYSGCDLIAMSTHGRGGLERLMMGSVTEGVLDATKLPMLIVPPQRCSAT